MRYPTQGITPVPKDSTRPADSEIFMPITYTDSGKCPSASYSNECYLCKDRKAEIAKKDELIADLYAQLRKAKSVAWRNK